MVHGAPGGCAQIDICDTLWHRDLIGQVFDKARHDILSEAIFLKEPRVILAIGGDAQFVKQRSSSGLVVSNQSSRYVFVSVLITGSNYQATLQPFSGAQSLGSHGEVTIAHYSFPSSESTSCDET